VRRARWVLWWVGALAVLGCGPDPNAPELATVEGTVYLNDTPLAGANVTFTPTGGTRGVVSTGRTGPDGRYSLKTVRGKDGASVGEHKVVISKRKMPDGSEPSGEEAGEVDSRTVEWLPEQYSSPEHTKLTRTVKADGGPIDFRLKSDKK
jgi:hypothetical protein